MQLAVMTRYAGPTNTHPGRILVTLSAPDTWEARRRIAVPFRHALDITENHTTAAHAALARTWPDMYATAFVSAPAPGGQAWVHVFTLEPAEMVTAELEAVWGVMS